ncbi:MAG: FtsQ-type POTRA domain-containing protein [Verrucomicrobiales bacterium]|jgi:cell division septal protein FtsQ|nr:FtsQ-type POTRA domain-containing protein [Verrucomicrobiales bacterium]
MARSWHTVGGRRRNVLHVEVQKRSRSKKARLLALKWGGVLALSVALIAALWFGLLAVLEHALYRNPDFALREVEVQVQGAVSRAEVLRTAGLRTGQNIMALDLGRIRQSLRQISYVDTVRVERALPSRLKIVIEERQPVARIDPRSASGNELAQATYYIDAEGYMMRPKPGEELKLLPVIKGVPADQVQDGQRTDRPEILSALNLLRLADYAALKGDLDLTQIGVDSKGYLVLNTRDQGRIHFRTDFLAEQVRRLKTILEYAHERGLVIRTVDLTPERNVPVVFANL